MAAKFGAPGLPFLTHLDSIRLFGQWELGLSREPVDISSGCNYGE